jgi:hypothetical protein
MVAPQSKLDGMLKTDSVEVEAEQLVEPEGEPPNQPAVTIKERLSRYSNRVLSSAERLFQVLVETGHNIWTALTGSIVLLPAVILVRGVKVLSKNVVALIKPIILSLFRAIFDALRGLIWPVHEVFYGFNKRVLFPLLKRIREDDTAALVAFALLLVLVGGVIFALTRIL